MSVSQGVTALIKSAKIEKCLMLKTRAASWLYLCLTLVCHSGVLTSIPRSESGNLKLVSCTGIFGALRVNSLLASALEIILLYILSNHLANGLDYIQDQNSNVLNKPNISHWETFCLILSPSSNKSPKDKTNNPHTHKGHGCSPLSWESLRALVTINWELFWR